MKPNVKRSTTYSQGPVLNHPKSENSLPKAQPSDEVERILVANTHFERLSLKIAEVEPQAVREAYKKIALKVHPDKCQNPKATEAFQILSEAFDTLYDINSQKQYFLSLTTSSRQPYARPNQQQSRKPKKTNQPEQKWWEKRSIDEILRNLRQREEQEALLRQKFIQNTRNKMSAKKTLRDLIKSSRICEELDSRVGIKTSPHWPIDELEPFSAEEQAQRLSEVVEYLRTSHFYCVFCSITFQDTEDMNKICPGPSSADHE